jgi:hypothetical protein
VSLDIALPLGAIATTLGGTVVEGGARTATDSMHPKGLSEKPLSTTPTNYRYRLVEFYS